MFITGSMNPSACPLVEVISEPAQCSMIGDATDLLQAIEDNWLMHAMMDGDGGE
jgi:hypothetical protein